MTEVFDMGHQGQLAEWIERQIGEECRFSSQRSFAKAANLSDTTIRRIKQGDVPTLRTLEKLAGAVPGVDVDTLQRMARDEYDPEQSPDFYEQAGRVIADLLRRLPRNEVEEVLDIVKTLVNHRRDRRASDDQGHAENAA